MHIITFADSPDHVSVRYRIEPLRRALEQARHRFDIVGLPASVLGRLGAFRQARHADVVIVQRSLLSTYELRVLRHYAKYLIYDVDDAVFRRDSFYGKQRSPKMMARFRYLLQLADRVIVGNAFLAESAIRYHAHPDKVLTIPTTLDVERYRPAEHQREGKGIRLAWIGTFSTLRGVERERWLWETLGSALNGLELHVICDHFPQFDKILVEPIYWNQQTETEHLAASDIGLAWMPDDEWSRGKCGLKLLQYMAAGLPIVANPVGVHREMVQSEYNGYLLTTPQEWISAVRQLMSDAQLRRRLGTNGRTQVELFYSHQQMIELWKPVFSHIPVSQPIFAA